MIYIKLEENGCVQSLTIEDEAGHVLLNMANPTIYVIDGNQKINLEDWRIEENTEGEMAMELIDVYSLDDDTLLDRIRDNPDDFPEFFEEGEE